MLVECRVPAYNRPELLDRALRSLLAQTHREWVAVVLDDSREASGRPVVDSIGDPRVQYRQNRERLGSTGNLNMAFSPEPMAGGEFAFILEDDNAVTPDFISTALRRIDECGLDVISLNQKCVAFKGFGENKQVIGAPMRSENSQPAAWSFRRLVLNVFLKPSLPNGCYFWKSGSCNLKVDEGIKEPMLQESARQLTVARGIVLCPEVGSLWSDLPASLVRRGAVNAQVFRVTRDLLAIALLRQYSQPLLVQWAHDELDEPARSDFRKRLASFGLIFSPCAPRLLEAPIEAMKTFFRHMLYRGRVDSGTRGALQRISRNEAPL